MNAQVHKEDMRTIQLQEENFYHVFNRGVDKRQVFMDEHDFLRFYVSLYAFNDENYQGSLAGGLDVNAVISSHTRTMGSHSSGMGEAVADMGARRQFVDIHAFCLIGNHFHLLLRQNTPRGVSNFMQRLTQGYTRYFNMRYERSGALFQGAFKAVPVNKDSQLVHLPRYIHLNALDGFSAEWRNGKIEDWSQALVVLDKYRWSSHHVFAGRQQLLPVVQETQVLGYPYRSAQAYEDFLRSWSSGYFLYKPKNP